jgi:hypothetical protein
VEEGSDVSNQTFGERSLTNSVSDKNKMPRLWFMTQPSKEPRAASVMGFLDRMTGIHVEVRPLRQRIE